VILNPFGKLSSSLSGEALASEPNGRAGFMKNIREILRFAQDDKKGAQDDNKGTQDDNYDAQDDNRNYTSRVILYLGSKV